MTRVLIVDDKEENLFYLQSLLVNADCTVESAHHGAEALIKARLAPPDLVISDLLMPIMDGYTLLRHWKADARLQAIPFIVYTATYVDAEDERLALNLGADAYILKPTDPEHLIARLREVQANAASATPQPPRIAAADQEAQLKLYNDALIRKLEEKTLQLEASNRALREDVARRQVVEESLRLLGAAVEQAKESIIVTDAQLDAPGPRIVFVNPAYTRMTGYAAEESFGKSPRILQGPRTDRTVLRRLRENLERGEVFAGETVNYRKDGTKFDLEWQIAPVRNGSGETTHYVAIQRDITERKSRERELARAHRALLLLSACNETLVRTESEQALRDQICRAVVESGGYRMAWVGFAQDSEPWAIVPAAHAGVEEGYLSEIEVTWQEHAPRGQGPAGQTIRTGKAVVCTDIRQDSSLLPWHALAQRHGYRGMICLPLREDEHTFGLLGLYSAEVEPTSAEELALLQKLADNLAFGILNLRAQLERRRLRSLVVKVASAVTVATGTAFFGQLVRNLAEALGAHAAFVSELLPGVPPSARTLAGVVAGKDAENFQYLIAGTPCANLITSETFVVAQQAAAEYPSAERLGALGAQGYVGQRLDDSTGRPLGHLMVIFREPLKHTEFVTSTLQIFATRAASELERRETELQVHEQAALLDAAQEAIRVKDMDDRIIYWNKGAERTYGWTAEEALGRTTLELLYNDPAKFEEAAAAILEKGEWDGEIEQRTKDGRPITVESRWTLVRDAAGQPKSVLVITNDITARKRAEWEFAQARETMLVELERRVAERTQALYAASQEAERANRAKSEFLSRMSHELRTPLHAILGYAQLMEMDERSADEAEGVAQIVRAGNHLLGLVNEVLDIARVESGRLALTPEPVAVRAMLEEALSLVKPQAAQRDVRLEPLAGDADCEVLSNEQRFKQVMLNLLSNAVKFNHAGGTVAVSCEQRQDRVRISVADTGRGISAENLGKVFVPFERLDVGDTVIEGTGLGLSLSKHLIEAMGGGIGVASTPGEGSTFWAELPRFEATTAATEHSLGEPIPSAAERPRANAPRTVLYIEDNLSNSRLVERILARRPEVRLISAMQGSLGLELARQHLPELVLLDLHLPGLPGDEVLRQLRADPHTARLRVVIISADATAPQIARLRELGATDYLTKPIDVRKFLAVIDG